MSVILLLCVIKQRYGYPDFIASHDRMTHELYIGSVWKEVVVA
jgi:hypothetical protein